MCKIVFLDIDGVLNSNFRTKSHQKEISNGKMIEEDKIRLLAQLIHKTGACIILHSGWRTWFDEEMNPLRRESKILVNLLAKESLTLSGMTPDLTTEEIRKTKKFSLVKADEILLWLKTNPNTSGWVVLDDLDLHNDIIAEHQVKPDQTVGLTVMDVEKAEAVLMS